MDAVAAYRHFLLWRESHREVGLSVILVLLAATIFVVGPLAGTGQLSAGVAEALRFGLATTAILVVNRSRLIGVFVAMTFFVSLICTIYLTTGAAFSTVYLTNIGFTIAFELGVIWTVAQAVFNSGRITVHRIMGAVILYLYVGLIFASIYRLAEAFLHPSFSGLSPIRQSNLAELLYFSLSTLTTSEFGDIIPIHPFVRSLANLESVIGQLYPATFLARMVTLHGSDLPITQPNDQIP
jgi:hypothetical protein